MTRFRVRSVGGGACVIDLEREDLAVCWCGAAGSRYGGVAIDGLREAKRIAAALNTALREKARRKKERERRMNRSGPVRGDRRRPPVRWFRGAR